MKILNFGSLNLDYVYRVEHFVQPGETLAAQEQKIGPGGKGLNQSVAMARAGLEVWHAGCVGIGGESLERLLKENHVHTEYLRRTDEIQGNAVIQVNHSGENCILLYGGSNQAITPGQIAETIDNFEAGDYLVLQNEVSCLKEMIETAAEKGLRSVLNLSPFKDSLRSLDFQKISWLLVNEIEAGQLTGESDPERVWDYIHTTFPKMNVVMTMGSQGAWCFTPEEKVFQPTYQVNTVDTTGAGDTFTGYFLQGMTTGKSLQECMRQAAAAAALSVTRAGASESIPYQDEVRDFRRTIEIHT
ncbi:MAG: ribokinase [Lachnospiraceae bacterium]|nr:ribokinase [Lachnospiraceae bacterium]